ncbi:hypothetical protein POX_a00581 [Penicillium oxalicum]|uniref:hypothetical protein n=1 Tax=Penicillium oxalicum TaxID=69781 RepID=UPI0020B7B11A|nr:hypothetical protein POX_a00581 [Penicillium oxalicum]KAI2793991.1 hypothetical protein POX_a00581 [Penicillium oxalicum]
MNGDPLLIEPDGVASFIALGATGAVFQDNNGQHIESISELCIDREKFIYQTLPKSPYILDCLDIEAKGLRFQHYQLGNLRDYLQSNEIDDNIRDRWIRNTIDAVAFIHAYGVIHADISPRNFLVADDLWIKLCGFAGSVIGDLQPLVEDEEWYRISPLSPRTSKTDLFALGCPIYEISTGSRPYDEIKDTDEVKSLYSARIFPDADGPIHQSIIYKFWTSQYSEPSQLRRDFSRNESSERCQETPVTLW